ncbi:uncharacterized protein LOC135084822 [Ostrinia nubilalis]|uniref:uncharacterized protein LOC135084822 n=1 Tax=Ostrinia nubilalis TaxID=29057 RepID=UPI0030826669
MCRTGICRFGIGNWIFLVACFHLFTYARGGDELKPDPGVRFTTEPADLVALEGEPALLPCAAAAARAVRLSWRHSARGVLTRDHTITISDLYRRQLANGSLVIEKMSASLAGQYQCVAAVDGVGTIVSKTATVFLAELPTIAPGPRWVSGPAGGALLLACAVSAPPRLALRIQPAAEPPDRRVYGAARLQHQPPTLLLNVTWLRNGAPVVLEAGRVAVSGSGALELDPLRPRDAATYRCRVSLARRPHHYMSLKQAAWPYQAAGRWSWMHYDRATPPPTAAVLAWRAVRTTTCEYRGRGYTAWPGDEGTQLARGRNYTLRNGAPVVLEAGRVAVSGSGALELDLLRPRDAATYRCRVSLARRPHHYVTGPELEVRVEAEAGSEQPPRFVATPRELTVLEGSSVTFDCAAVGSPKPEMTWLNNGVEIDLSDLDSRFYRWGCGSLRVQSARALDAGAYTCRAHSRLDSADHTALLHVQTYPRVQLPGGSVVSARARGSATLACSVRGRPAPDVTWLKDGEPLSLNRHDITLVDGTSLHIQGVLAVDAGMFQCVATSSLGQAQASLRLVVLPPDDGINSPNSTAGLINSKSFLNSLVPTSMTSPSHTKTSFSNSTQDIFNSLVSSGHWGDQSADPTPEDLDFLGETSSAFTSGPELEYDYNYDADQTDENDLDSFHANEGLDLDQLRHANATVISPPKNLKAVIVKHRFVTLSWEEPDTKNEDISGYAVIYKVKGSERERVSRGGARHEMNVAALQPNTTYTFQLLAYTQHAFSPPTKPLEITTPEEELSHGAVRELRVEPASPHALRVSWAPPPPPPAGAPPDKYQITYTEVDSNREQTMWVDAPSDPAAPVNATLAGLRAAAAYTVRVAAAGGAPTERQARTPSAAPAAPPAGLTAVPTGATAVKNTHLTPSPACAPPPTPCASRPPAARRLRGEERGRPSPRLLLGLLLCLLGLRYSCVYTRDELTSGSGVPQIEVHWLSVAARPEAASSGYAAYQLPEGGSGEAVSILVRWEAPPAKTHHGALTGYKIRYRAVAPESAAPTARRKADSLTTPADARRAELRALQTATTYQIRVCAINVNGSGPFSEWVTATTQRQELDETRVPPQPPPLTIARAGRDWISVWWAEGGGCSMTVVHWKTCSKRDKSERKPLTDPKAYRPITLLSVLGKLLERVMLWCAPQISSGISDCQHGFSPGKSTVSALDAVIGTGRTSTARYVQAIFLDISGAFDNAWWPMIMVKVKRGGCPPNIYKMLASYFSGHRVGLIAGSRVLWKVSTMGCPQGSVLGPTLWNVLMDDLLRLPLPGGVSMVAYADDVTILIEANSRAAIEAAAAETLSLVTDWGVRNRLGFSPAKSSTMTIRGKLQRPPVIRFGGASIRSVNVATVLGVAIDSSLLFSMHAQGIVDRAAKCFGKMSRVSASSWGIRYPGLRILYQGTFVATLAYAAACWYERLSVQSMRTTILRGQRPALVLLTKAYRSVSTAALPVLAGVLPADLEVSRAGMTDVARRDTPRDAMGRRKREILESVLDTWQTRWEGETKGRELFQFFPDVAGRLGMRWVVPDYVTSQILTGHGCFNKRLCDMRLRTAAECECGEREEDRHHVLWSCPLYEDLRQALLQGIVLERPGPAWYSDLVSSEANFARLREFAYGWHRRRTASAARHQMVSSVLSRAGRDWISVWWAEGGGGGVAVRGWWLGWGAGVPDDHSRELPAHLHSHVIRELESNAEYVISLRGSNALGLGPAVYATVRTRAPPEGQDEDDDEADDEDEDDEPDPPDLLPPVGLKVIMLSGTTAVVYWTDPTLPKGQTATDGRRYVVRWAAAGAGAGAGRARTYNASDLNCMLDDLRPNTHYEFAVKLIKGGRESQWSMIVSNTTLEAVPSSPPRDLRVSAAAPPARAVELAWAPPARPNGIITGYVVMYAVARGGGAEEWTAVSVAGTAGRARVERLRPRTAYQFKVQARNSRGLGPASPPVGHTTAAEAGGGGGLASATSAWLWASAGGACAVLALAAALALSLCCRRSRPPLSPHTSTYQKSSASAGIKPPDLWIHHDQMELKHLDKSLHSSASKISAGSVDAPNLASSTLTLPRGAPPADYEPARMQPPPASLDSRHYVPTYVGGGTCPLGAACGAPPSTGGDIYACAARERGHYVAYEPLGHYTHRDSLSSDVGAGASSTLPHSAGPAGSMGAGGSLQRHARAVHSFLDGSEHSTPAHSRGRALCAGGSLQRHARAVHSFLDGSEHSTPAHSRGRALCAGGSLQRHARAVHSFLDGSEHSTPAHSRGRALCAGGSLQRHARAVHSFLDGSEHSTPAHSRGRALCAGGSLQRHARAVHSFLDGSEHSTPAHSRGRALCAGGSLQRHARAVHSFLDGEEHSTPAHSRAGSARETSPYKKSASSSPGHLPNRLQLGGAVAHCSSELEPLTPSRSTERLQREMQNLEGLMKDLSAITQQQFHC